METDNSAVYRNVGIKCLENSWTVRRGLFHGFETRCRVVTVQLNLTCDGISVHFEFSHFPSYERKHSKLNLHFVVLAIIMEYTNRHAGLL